MIDSNLIKKAIEEGYIEGIHKLQSKDHILRGFHEDFRMLIKNENKLETINIDQWLINLDKMIQSNSEFWSKKTHYSILTIDQTKDTAYAKVIVYKGEDYFSTDMFLLHQFKDGWKIVSKIFSV